MRDTLIKGYSMYQEDIAKLNSIAERTGLAASEVIRELIRKCYEDEVEMQIILQNFLKNEKGHITKERLLRIMSVRDTLKKAREAQRSQASAVSSNCQQDYKPKNNQETTTESMPAIIAEAVEAAKPRIINGEKPKIFGILADELFRAGFTNEGARKIINLAVRQLHQEGRL